MMRTENHRPQFHFSAAKNWINDPNGLVYFEGEYHLFYQCNPFGDQWGHMSWGHAVSRDMLHWQELPVAIEENERVSIFSGSVVVDSRNSSGLGDGGTAPLVAIYTGQQRQGRGQAQELAYSIDRGRTWTAYDDNPVLDLGLAEFRDPKVFWHDATTRWVMLVALPDLRLARFYSSPDLKSWTWLSDFSAPFDGQGIWECPDLIPLHLSDGGSTWLFKVDVLGGHPSGDSGARIVFGQFDGVAFTPDPGLDLQWADWGADFYAALSWSALPATSPTPVWLGWMNCHRYAKHLPTQPWRGSMSLPRELHAHKGPRGLQLLQRPLAVLQTLRGEHFNLKNLALDNQERALLPPGADGRALEIIWGLRASSANECGLLLRAADEAGGEATVVGYDLQQQTVFIDRSRSGFLPPDDALYARRRQAPLQGPVAGRPLRLHILLDWSSVEVFVDDGHTVLTEQIFPAESSRGLRLFARGGTAELAGVDVWLLAGVRP